MLMFAALTLNPVDQAFVGTPPPPDESTVLFDLTL